MYRPNFYESTCLRCSEIVYQVDRIGPLKDFTFFHSGCFKCVHCGTKLTLKTYYNNQHKHDDKEVGGVRCTYCEQIINKLNCCWFGFVCLRSTAVRTCRRADPAISIKRPLASGRR